MRESRELIRNFLEAEEVVYSIEPDGAFRFVTELCRESHIRSCATLLKCDEKRLLVSYELPLRVPRRACESVEWNIARINAQLCNYEAFETDLLDGLVRYRLTAELPSSIPAVYIDDVHRHLYRLLEHCMDTVEKYVNDIADLIFTEMSPYTDETSDSIGKSRKNDPLINMLKFLGLVEDRE